MCKRAQMYGTSCKKHPRKQQTAATTIATTTATTPTTCSAPRIRRYVHAVPLQDLNVCLAAELSVGDGDAPGGVLQEARGELHAVVDTQLADEHRHEVRQVARAAPLLTHAHEAKRPKITTHYNEKKMTRIRIYDK